MALCVRCREDRVRAIVSRGGSEMARLLLCVSSHTMSPFDRGGTTVLHARCEQNCQELGVQSGRDALTYAWQPGRGGAEAVNPAGPHFRAAAIGDSTEGLNFAGRNTNPLMTMTKWQNSNPQWRERGLREHRTPFCVYLHFELKLKPRSNIAGGTTPTSSSLLPKASKSLTPKFSPQLTSMPLA